MASTGYYARATDIVTPSATVSVISGTADSLFPATNTQDRNSAKAGKATGTSITYRYTFGSAQLLEGVAVINHNHAGATVSLSNNAGMSGLSIPVAANGLSGQRTDYWKDLRLTHSAGQRSATQWDVAISGGALGNVATGEVLLTTNLRDLKWLQGVKFKVTRLASRDSTFGGTLLQYDKKVRIRRAVARVVRGTEETAMKELEEAAKGAILPWLIVPDKSVNECFYVQFDPNTFEYGGPEVNVADIPISLIEVSSGPPLFV